ncbi:site-specific integrase [Nocardioides piscis]|uniref:Site-specific integrase n=1 Tax=Nocardioides piscis TaxID=2714938 RepID=A0A6G7YD51_9ACTN|nr:site-specific integrase [Nocardioides piscis]QIK74700.1 site-specific integrase [Nocardioides piscis]
MKARLFAWPADDRGWPVDPSTPLTAPEPLADFGNGPATAAVARTHTFESYVWDVWWPTLKDTFEDKNRLGHRRNAEVAVALLRYGARRGDLRIDSTRVAGQSIALADLVSDDLRWAVVQRRSINGRTAAANARLLSAAPADDAEVVDIALIPEVASVGTVRAFAVTVGMIIKAATASEYVHSDPMRGVMALAPKPKPSKVGARLVPTIDELFDLADAFAELGALMPDGRRTGERFRSLVLAGGTLGARPGELVAHRPEWVWCAGPPLVRFAKTEAAVYNAKEGSPGRREKGLKHRDEDEHRDVPALPEVLEALHLHLERGYGSVERTWLSRTGRGHLDWHNIRDTHWRPALERVFAGTAKDALVSATPKILRKTAITWWLESGVAPTVAADWAGHTEEVMRLYYASRASATWAVEADLLRLAREATSAGRPPLAGEVPRITEGRQAS